MNKADKINGLLNNTELDQFYTNPLTAKKLTSIFTEKLKELDYQKINFLEPSAGTGNFLEAIREISKNKVQSSIFNYQGFPSYICVSLNNELTHGIPDDRPFQDGDLVSIDVACNCQGYHADAALTLIIGDGDAKKKDLLRVTKNSLYYTIQSIQPNITTTQDIGATLEKFIRSRGYYPIKEYGGHIIGTSMHSDTYQDQEVKIFIPNYKTKGKGKVLRAGMFICIEPLVQISDAKVEVATDKWTVFSPHGNLNAHFEHTVYIGSEKAEILTNYDE